MKNYVIKKQYRLAFLLLFCGFAGSLTLISCGGNKDVKDANPPGYDLAKPHKYNMPDVLQEISGITFLNGDTLTIYAEQDEEGKVFMLSPGSKAHKDVKFSKKGDYEDIAIVKDRMVVLKSNGNLYTFPFSETALPTENSEPVETSQTAETESILPKGEYESMFADASTGQLYVLCKECKQDKGTKNTSGFILTMQDDGRFTLTGNFNVDVSTLDKLTGRKKGTFHPSAIAMHPITKEWYILSAINKALVVTDQQWKVKAAYHLSSNIFNQPEGIAFDKDANMYISNEGSDTQYGNILKYNYKAGKK